MNKSIILPSLVAALALASCGKKETYGVHSIIQQHGKIVAMLVTA